MAAIGIDFGYSYIRVGVLKEELGFVQIIENEFGDRTTPTIVAFDNKHRLIGIDAKGHSAINPEAAFYGIKRLIGRHREDDVFKQQLLKSGISIDSNTDKMMFKTSKLSRQNRRTKFTATEMLAIILAKIVEDTEKEIASSINMAVISVPSYFTNYQRQAMIDAANIVGIAGIRLLNNSTAAAVNFAYDKMEIDECKKLMVIDFGSSSFEASIINVNKTKSDVNVLSTAGCTSLGGVDFDNRLIDFCLKKIVDEYRVDISSDRRMLQKLRNLCEKAKITLQSKQEARFEIDTPFNGICISLKIKRDEFELLCKDLIELAMQFVRKVLQDGRMKKTDVDEIILVGGSSRIKNFESSVVHFFDGKRINRTLNVDESVVNGCALRAAELNGVHNTDKLQLNIKELIPFNIIVSIGNDANEMKTMKCPLSLLCNRFTSLPHTTTVILTLQAALHRQAIFDVYVGDCGMVTNYKYLTTLQVSGFNGQRNYRVVEVKLIIDGNGIIYVTFIEMYSDGVKQLDVVDVNQCHTDKEIQNMRSNIQHHKEEMQLELARISYKNDYEKNLFEFGKLVTELESYNGYNYGLNWKVKDASEWITKNSEASSVTLKARSKSIAALIDDVKSDLSKAIQTRNNLVTKLKEVYARTLQMYQSVLDREAVEFKKHGLKFNVLKKWLEKDFKCDNEEIKSSLNNLNNLCLSLEDIVKKEIDQKLKAMQSLKTYCSSLVKPFDAQLKINRESSSYSEFLVELNERINKAEELVKCESATKQQFENTKSALKAFVEKNKDKLVKEEEERVKALNDVKTFLGNFANFTSNQKVSTAISEYSNNIVEGTENWIETHKCGEKSLFIEKLKSLQVDYKELKIMEEKQSADTKTKKNESKSLLSSLSAFRFWNSESNVKVEQYSIPIDSSASNSKSGVINNTPKRNTSSLNAKFERKLKTEEIVNSEAPAKRDGVHAGIDIGNFECGLSVVANGDCSVINLESDASRTATFISFTKNGIIIGSQAKANTFAADEAGNTLFHIKNIMGRINNCFSDTVGKLPFAVDTTFPKIKIKLPGDHNGKSVYSPEEIVAMFMMHMQLNISNTFREFSSVALTVPTNFNCNQRQAMFDAAVIAGFKNISLVNDTTAAAIGYLWNQKHISKNKKLLLVISIGAAYTNISVINVQNRCLSVQYSPRGLQLGGHDFDDVLRKNVFPSGYQTDYMKKFEQELYCEKLKIKLSYENEVVVNSMGSNNSSDVRKITRDNFEGSCSELFKRILNFIRRTLNEAKVTTSDINDIILSGGTTLIPKIVSEIKKCFQESKVYEGGKDLTSQGAAIFAANSKKYDPEVITVNELATFSYSVESIDLETPMLMTNSIIPQSIEGSLTSRFEGDKEFSVCLYEKGYGRLYRYVIARFHIKTDSIFIKGESVFKLRLSIDSNGLINFIAAENGSGKELKLSLPTQLSDQEIKDIIISTSVARELLFKPIYESNRIRCKKHLQDTITQYEDILSETELSGERYKLSVKLDHDRNWLNRGEHSEKEYEDKLKEIELRFQNFIDLCSRKND